VHGGVGIMLDDLVAGLDALWALQAELWLIKNLFCGIY